MLFLGVAFSVQWLERFLAAEGGNDVKKGEQS